MSKKVDVFKRKAWRFNPVINEFEPHNGTKRYIRRQISVGEARDICREHNKSRPPAGTKGYYNFVYCEFQA